jgi:ArsR family metal-binding transcriptional regulator
MTRELKTDARLSTPVDPKKDQVDESRRILREMWDKANRAIDEQTRRSAPRK